MAGILIVSFSLYLVAGAMVHEALVARLDEAGRARWKRMNPFMRYLRVLAAAVAWPFRRCACVRCEAGGPDGE